MVDVKDKLVNEHDELKHKLLKLIDFINDEAFFALDFNQQQAMKMQRIGMEIYLNALNARIYDTISINENILPLLTLSMFNNSFSAKDTKDTEYLKKMLDADKCGSTATD